MVNTITESATTTHGLEDIDISVGEYSIYRKELERGSTHVGINKEGTIKVPEGQAERIYTDSLLGCTAIAIFDWDKRGNRLATVLHIDPVKLGSKRRRFPKPKTNKAKAVIMTPGKGPIINATEMTAENVREHNLEGLRRGADRIGGVIGSENVTIVPYDDHPEEYRNDYTHTLFVDIPEKGEGTIVAGGTVAR